MKNIIINVDENIKLKSWQPDFAAELFALVDKNRDYLSPWLPWVPFIKEVKNSQDFINSSLTQMENNSGLELGIWYQDKLVGCIGLHDFNLASKRAGIGYWLDKDHQGQGTMTKSVKALIDYSFSELNLNRLTIMASTINPHSYSIAERLGFKKEGIIRQYEFINNHFSDCYQYSLLKSENN